MRLLAIALGGGLGAMLRFSVSGLVQQLTEDAFPVGTLAVNVVGCLLIGFLGALFSGPALVRDEVRLFLLTGFLGGFTTFSTFAYESAELLRLGFVGRALLNAALQKKGWKRMMFWRN